jgi:outer membrane protein OmpA-like peptidoglycan-associated protein
MKARESDETKHRAERSVHARLGDGKPIEAGVRAEMAGKLGRSFEDVRVHTGPAAGEAAASLNARAFTSGKHIVFDQGQYNPWSPDGRELLAHELAHTAQRPATGAGISAPGDAGEREATGAAQAVATGRTASVGQAPGAAIARQEYPGVMGGRLSPPSGDLELEVTSPMMAAAIGSATIDGFATGKADLTTDQLGVIGMTGLRIQKLLRRFGTSTIEVTGHTDTMGEEGSNFRLGQARADAVRDKLIDAGVPAGIIAANSAGEGGRQAVPTKDQVANAKNRRAEIRFKPGKSFPGILGEGLKLDPPGQVKQDKKKPFDWGRIGPGGVKPDKIDRGPIFTDPFPPGKEESGLPPDFWKPIPPAKSNQKSVIDVVGEKILDPAIDDLFGWLSKDKRAWLKEKAREGVAKGATAGAKAAAQSLGVTDAKALEGIEKAVEAGIKYKGEKPGEGGATK